MGGVAEVLGLHDAGHDDDGVEVGVLARDGLDRPTPTPGTGAAEALGLLGVVGEQRFSRP